MPRGRPKANKSAEPAKKGGAKITPVRNVSPGAARAQEVADNINAQSKEGDLIIASPLYINTPYHIRRPTQIMELDMHLAGGFPAGTMVRVGGPDGAGKTVLSYMTVAAIQDIYGDEAHVALACTEYLPDFWFMRKLGVRVAIPQEQVDMREEHNVKRDLPRFTPEERAELASQTGKIDIIYGDPGESMLGAVLDVVARDTAQLVVIDSMAMLDPAEEQEKDMDERSKMSARASMITRFQTKLHKLLLRPSPKRRMNQTTILEIDQVRANKERANAPGPMQKFISEWKMATPWASNHGNVLTMIVKHGEKIRDRIPARLRGAGEKSTAVMGREMQWAITKGKYGVHENLSGSVPYRYDTLIDLEESVLHVGLAQGLIREQGGILQLYDSTGKELMSFASPDEFKQALMNDRSFNWEFRTELLYRSGVSQCSYK